MSNGGKTGRSVFAVIMAGGSGTRFWPFSRKRRPKYLLDIFGDKSILQQTFSRLLPLVPPERIIVVATREQVRPIRCQLPILPRENIIAEPAGRNTAPCIGLAAGFIRRRAEDAVMVVLPADQLIVDEESFRRVLSGAIETARRTPVLVTIGIRPTGPETGYGYIEMGESTGKIRGEKVYRVSRFHEKPSLELASQYLARGNYLWNSGMFIWQAGVIQEEIDKFLPALSCLRAQVDPGSPRVKGKKSLKAVYQSIEAVSIDYGVMEKSDRVVVIPGEFDWRDMGSWDAFWEFSGKDREGNALQTGHSLLMDTKNSLVVSPGKTVVMIGVEDLLVMETKDVLLICRRGRSQQVGQAPKLLGGQGKDGYL